jgi:hypothetical protein
MATKKHQSETRDALQNLLRYLTHSDECDKQTKDLQELIYRDCWCGLNQAKRRFVREVLFIDAQTVKRLSHKVVAMAAMKGE